MTVTAYPFADVDSTESQYGALFALLQDDGLAGIPGDLDGRVIPATGLTVSAGSFGACYLAGVLATSDAAVAVTLDAAAAAATRVDRIVVRVNTDNTVQVGKLTGIPGGGAPTVTRTPGGLYELSLARVTVAAGVTTLTSSNIVDERAWTSSRVGAWTTGTRPAARRGRLGFNSDLSAFEFYTGTSWSLLGGGGSATNLKVWNAASNSYEQLTGSLLLGGPGTPAVDGDAWITST